MYEDLSVLRCYKCQKFRHKGKDCINALVCPICSESHEEKNCPKEKKSCVNCILSNQKYNTRYETIHCATSFQCHAYLCQIQKLKDKALY